MIRPPAFLQHGPRHLRRRQQARAGPVAGIALIGVPRIRKPYLSTYQLYLRRAFCPQTSQGHSRQYRPCSKKSVFSGNHQVTNGSKAEVSMRLLYGVVAVGSLLACLAAPVVHVWSEVSAPTYNAIFLVASAGWFASAWAYDASRGRP